MEQAVFISAAVAFSAFCIMHTVKIVTADQKERRRREDIEKTKNELENEIMHEGHPSRIRALKCRLHDLGAD